MGVALTVSSFAKKLASCNTNTREKALRVLHPWMNSQENIDEEDMRKIWKGLFYCVWHADKQSYQLDLIDRLSSVLVNVDLEISIRYFGVFLDTIRREWSGIDYLRLDKFYLLIRRFLHNFYLLLKKNQWDIELLKRLMTVFSEKTLLVDDKFPAQGVNYHISEIFLEELACFLPLASETVDVLLNPFFTMLEKNPDKALLNKIKSNMFDFLLRNGRQFIELRKAGEKVESGDNICKFGPVALSLGLSAKFFKSASSPDSLQGNRKFLFALHDNFYKLEKDLEKSGIEISIPQSVEVRVGKEINSLLGLEQEQSQVNGSGFASKNIGRITEISLETDQCIDSNTTLSVDNLSKKLKKGKKASSNADKKSKTKKKKKKCDSLPSEDNCDVIDEGNCLSNSQILNECSENHITFTETVMSNLQKKFEKVAAEVGMDTAVSITDSSMALNRKISSKKRKRTKSVDKVAHPLPSPNEDANGGSMLEKTGENSAKRVRFSMKSNLVWKPHSPLPPQSLRLPPSVTPRGSALKKGIPPGPVREMPLTKKVKKRAKILKKGRKAIKGVAPAVKRLRKLQSVSP